MFIDGYRFVLVLLMVFASGCFSLGESSSTANPNVAAPQVVKPLSYSASDLSGSVDSKLDFPQYAKQLQREIHAYWGEGKNGQGRRVTLDLRVGRDGKLSEIKVAKSSGNKKFDRLALRALNFANPVTPPPTELYDQFQRLRVVFDDARG